MLIRFLPSGLEAHVPRGTTLLEAARAAGSPLGCACHGERVCGRCRLRVLEGAESLGAREADETRVLERIGAGPDERLGCCASVLGPSRVTVTSRV